MHMTQRFIFGRAVLPAVLGAAAFTCGCTAHNHLTKGTVIPADTYAIVASSSVANDFDWNDAIVNELKKKYPNATVLTWEKDVNEVREALAALKPSFTAFAVKPGEAGVRFTITVSHMTRRLDDDPYTDTLWGVITGYDADSARKVAAAGPIAIERALDCSGCDLTVFQKAWRYSEDHRGTMKTWDATVQNPQVVTSECNTDNTLGVLERLQTDKVQFLATSGHATQDDWQMGYCGPNMVMTHKEGQLLALDTEDNSYFIQNDEPKVYFANGNCLIGDIDQRDCMALAWMRSGGVRQMMGYTVTTWFGAQGWGTLGLYTDTAGMTTAAEAFHFTNAGIVHSLENAIEITGAADIRDCKLGKIAQLNRPLTRQLLSWHSELTPDEQNVHRDFVQQVIGNLHDRDVVCFYGDPALDTHIAKGRFNVLPPTYNPMTRELTLTLHSVSAKRDGAVWFRLPGSWEYDVDALEANEALGQPDLCLDNMIRFPNAKVTEGKTYTVTLKAAKNFGENCQACDENK